MSGQLTIRKFILSRQQLRSIAEDERILLIQLAHFYNTIQILQQLLIFTYRLFDAKTPAEDARLKARVAQNSLVARLLISSLWEGWKVLEASFFGAKLSRAHEARLTPEGKSELDFLKKSFSGKSVMKEVRDRFGFHFDREEIRREFDRMNEDTDYHAFVGERRGNSLYYFAEEIAGMAMLGAIRDLAGVEDPLAAQNLLYDAIVKQSRSFQRVIEEVMGNILTADIQPRLSSEEVLITDVPELFDISIPFFVMPPPPGTTLAGQAGHP